MKFTTASKWATQTFQPHHKQRKPRLFHRFGKEEALAAIRSMLDNPTHCYQTMAQRFGVTRQRIAQIAAEIEWTGEHGNASASCSRRFNA